VSQQYQEVKVENQEQASDSCHRRLLCACGLSITDHRKEDKDRADQLQEEGNECPYRDLFGEIIQHIGGDGLNKARPVKVFRLTSESENDVSD